MLVLLVFLSFTLRTQSETSITAVNNNCAYVKPRTYSAHNYIKTPPSILMNERRLEKKKTMEFPDFKHCNSLQVFSLPKTVRSTLADHLTQMLLMHQLIRDVLIFLYLTQMYDPQC